jgi:hypothetical protein
MFDESSIMPYIVVFLVALAAAAGIYMARKDHEEFYGPPVSVDTSSAPKWRYYYKTPPPGMSENWHQDNQAGIHAIWNKMRLELPLMSSRPNRAERAENRNRVRT